MSLQPPTPPDPDGSYDVSCPHCGKAFESALLTGTGVRQQGFKCPHCRLFVAFDRADEQDLVEQREG